MRRTPDSFAILADNGTLTLWDYDTGTPFQNMEDVPQPGSLEAEAGVFCSTFDQTGTRLITGGADKTIKVGHLPYHDRRSQRKRLYRYTRSNHNESNTGKPLYGRYLLLYLTFRCCIIASCYRFFERHDSCLVY